MKKIIGIITIAILLASCGQKKPQNPQNKEMPNRVVPVMVETVELRDLNHFVPVSGRLEGSVDMVMSSETSGKITVLYKSLGDKAEKGEELGAIDNLEYKIQMEQAKASLLAAEASYELAEITWKTNEKLYDDKKISQVELIQAKSAFLNAKSGVQAAKANLERAEKNYENSILVIPVSGYIANLPIKVGEFITIGKPIATIINTDTLKIYAGVGEKNITRLKRGQLVNIFDGHSNQNLTAKITGIGKKMMQGTANYPIEIELNNPDGKFLPGMLVQVNILSKTYEDIINTNLNNILQQYSSHYVYVIDEENIAHKKPVALGVEIGEVVIINDGLQPNDKLVVEGMANLEEGTLVEIRSSIK
jgi:RND family efflux transporter MFP subunit